MTPEDQYENAVKMATDMARLINSEQQIIDFGWCPFQLLYTEMIKRKEITPLSELSIEEKRKYWDKVKDLECPKYRKIWVCQALYLYELITERQLTNKK